MNVKVQFPDEQRREKWIAITLCLLLLLCYTYVFPRWADPNQDSRLDMVVAVVDEGTFQIDRYVENTVDHARAATYPLTVGRGLLLGYSVVTKYPSTLVVGILFVYTFSRLSDWRRIGWVVLPGALIAAGWMIYNTAVFGSSFELGYSYSELWTEQHHTGFMSLTWPCWEAIWGITFSALGFLSRKRQASAAGIRGRDGSLVARGM